jgi:hypothetical protein
MPGPHFALKGVVPLDEGIVLRKLSLIVYVFGWIERSPVFNCQGRDIYIENTWFNNIPGHCAGRVE